MTEEIARAIPHELPQEDSCICCQSARPLCQPEYRTSLDQYHAQLYTKLEMRVVQVLQRYAELYKTVPEHFALGFAAYIVFMHPVKRRRYLPMAVLMVRIIPLRMWRPNGFTSNGITLQHSSWFKMYWAIRHCGMQTLPAIPGFAERVTENVEKTYWPMAWKQYYNTQLKKSDSIHEAKGFKSPPQWQCTGGFNWFKERRHHCIWWHILYTGMM